jgi:hypothetical protein
MTRETDTARKTFTPQDRDRIVGLVKAGRSNLEIARSMGIHGHVVNSIINGARRRNELPYTGIPKEARVPMNTPNAMPRLALPGPIQVYPPRPLPFKHYTPPIKILRKSLMNRMGEVRQTVESIMNHLKEKDIPTSEVRGEVVLLNILSSDIERLLEQIIK